MKSILTKIFKNPHLIHKNPLVDSEVNVHNYTNLS